jgi:hypothetical protein
MVTTPGHLISPSRRVERQFFRIAYWFILIATTAALIAAIIAAVYAGSKFFIVPDTRIHAPTTSYGDFRSTAAASRPSNEPQRSDTTLQDKQEAAARAAAEAEFEKRLKPYLDAIVTSLTAYAGKVSQAKPSAQAAGEYVRRWMQEIGKHAPDDLVWKYPEGLSNAARDLAADGDRLAKLDNNDPQRVRWDSFIEWYSKRYLQQIGDELRRIEFEKRRAVASLAEAPMLFYVAASAFAVFVLGTLLLVLLRIEFNTRTD